jgi:hypothetical protein
MVYGSSSSIHYLVGGEAPCQSPTAPLTIVSPDKTGPFDLSHWTVRFLQFQARSYDSCSIHVATHFGNSAGESTTSRASSMKGGNSGTNGSDLDKNNIIKPTFNALIEEGHKALEAYRANLEELLAL